MSRQLVLAFLLALSLCTLACPAHAQSCAPPIIAIDANTYNIFSPEQEMVLGELTYQRISGELRFVRDPGLLAYVNEIGEKLIRHLPPTGLRFQFLIVDLPSANAFNVPGGYVFISRKLIGFAHNEDELAGVIAHELGHATVRHGASNMSELFKKILNVTRLGDRKDVVEKYNLFLERQRTKKISLGTEDESGQQLQADRIGLFALVAAGYNPNAFGNFFGRLVESKGKTGNWLADIFGTLKPEEKRLREMIKLTEQLPAECRDNRRTDAAEAFLKWQAEVVSFRDVSKKEVLEGLLWKKDLAPKLRSDISHFSFSWDGKYLLAQDDFGITVIQREPLQVTFQIPTQGANEATFTPDGQFVVFGTKTLRYEKWSLADKKPVEIRELVVRRDCWQHEFSPDGRYLSCVDYELNLNVLETQTGKKIWEKKGFHQLSFLEYLTWVIWRAREDSADAAPIRLFNMEFSPDSRFLVVSSQSGTSLAALDLSTVTTVSVGGGLKQLTRGGFLFLGSNRILALALENSEDSGVFSFPEGKRITKFSLAGRDLKRTANPNYVIVKPMANARMGVFDLTRNMVVSALNKADAALWSNLMVLEGASGKIRITEVAYDEEKKFFQSREVGSVDIPAISIGRPSVAAVADNFQWLAVSSKSRGALWNLGTGERKMFVRGFRGVVLANDGTGIGEFPKLPPINHSLILLNPVSNTAEQIRELPEKGASQYGRFVMIRQTLKETKKDNALAETDGHSLERGIRMELRDVTAEKPVWARDFPKEAPRFFFDEFSGRLIFYWDLGSDAGKSKLTEDPALADRAKEMGNKDDDFLMEIVDAFAGKTIGMLLLETGKGSFELESGYSEGNWLVLHDSNNRILGYSIKDGELRHRFFGGEAAINPSRNQLIVENYPGELTLYDLTTGDAITRLNLNSDAAFVRFGLDGKRLFVLSSAQTAYAFDVDKLVSRVPPARQ